MLAYGGPITTSTHSFDGESWLTITGWFVVVNEGVGCLGTTGYRSMMAHELGHGLGFGHVEDSRALMYASCCRDINETDRTCSTYAYPALDEVNERPRALAGADMDVVLLGDTVRLRATVSDDGLPVDRELESSWAVISGPGEVVFTDPGAPSTTASFSESGQYLLSLVAHDGELLHVDQVEVNVEILVGSKARESFRQGSDGYSAAVDTYVEEASPAEAHGAAQALRIDSDSPGGSGNATQGLLRFGDIFGPQPGRLPPGVEIERAWLELETTNTGDGAAIYRMLQPWSELSVWSDFGGDGIQPGVESVSALQADVVGAGGTVEVDVTESLAAWSLDPSANNGWAFLPVGSDGWQFASSDSGASAPRLLVEYPLIERREPVSIGDDWDYFKGNRAVDEEWREVDFVPDDSWLVGPSGIGYGDDDDATVLDDMANNYIAVYMRIEFDVPEELAEAWLQLRVRYAHSFVAYIDGEEVARRGIDGSPPLFDQGASVEHEITSADGFDEEFLLEQTELDIGRHVLAVEVHNINLGSSDLSFSAELVGSQLLVTSVDPAFGPLEGGNTVRVYALGIFPGLNPDVIFGNLESPSVTVEDDYIEAEVPAAKVPGAVDIIIDTVNATTVIPAGYIYANPDGGMGGLDFTGGPYATAEGFSGMLGEGTLQAWFRRGAGQGQFANFIYSPLASIEAADGSDAFILEVRPGNIRARTAADGDFNDLTAAADLPEGEWHNICCTFSERGRAIYLDGRQIAADNFSTNLSDCDRIRLGSRFEQGGGFFSGDLTGTIHSAAVWGFERFEDCLLYTSPSPRDLSTSRMPSSA